MQHLKCEAQALCYYQIARSTFRPVSYAVFLIIIILARSFIQTCVCHLLQDSHLSLNIKLYRN